MNHTKIVNHTARGAGSPDAAGEGVGTRRCGPVRIVAADAVTRLSATVCGCAGPAVTVVFCHGLGLHSAVWAPQIDGLRRRHRDLRVVSYDHRGHGGSTCVDPAACTVTQLGDDLAAVLDAVAPGPVVLVGHSLGGMAILAFAAAHPQMVADRVVGVALLATAATHVTRAGAARLLAGPVAPTLRMLSRQRPGLLAHGWDLSRRALSPLIGRPWPGTAAPVVAVGAALTAGAMIHRTDVAVLAGYLADVATCDLAGGLCELASVPALVMCGTRDRVLPLHHSCRISEALPCSELVAVPGAGHMIGLDSPAVVTTHLDRFLGRALARTSTACRGRRGVRVCDGTAQRRPHVDGAVSALPAADHAGL